MHNLEQLKTFRTKVRDLAGDTFQAEYRRDRDTSVGVSLEGVRKQRINVQIRENEPSQHPDGYELYPYKGLTVVFQLTGKPLVREAIGIKKRDAKGVLVDWTDWTERTKAPRVEMEGIIGYPVIDINVEPYITALDVTKANIHDQYGRTHKEQETETHIIAEFAVETSRLLDTRHPGRHHPLTLDVTTSSTFTTSYGEVTITDRGAKKGIIVSIDDATKEPPLKIYQVRRSDKRLGLNLNRGKKTSENPASIAEGERLITLLKSIN